MVVSVETHPLEQLYNRITSPNENYWKEGIERITKPAELIIKYKTGISATAVQEERARN